MSSYDQWAGILTDQFFSTAQDQQPAVMFVDDHVKDELRAVSGCPGLLPLDEAVRQELGTSANPLGNIFMRVSRWRKQPQTQEVPPTLPLLAVTVLAATRMGDSGTFSSHNYYGRLAPLLGTRPDVASASFDHIAHWWRDLDSWLRRQGGTRGISTITGHPHLTKIGWALSQALLRESDRRTLAQFFHYAGVGQRAQMSGAELYSALTLWADGRSGLSPRFRRLAASPAERPLLERLLEVEARAWDGQVPASASKGGARLRLLIQPRQQQLSWAVQIPPEQDAAAIVAGLGSTAVTAFPSGSYLRIDKPGLRPADISSGTELQAGAGTLRWPARPPVIVMVRDAALDGWISADRLNFDDEQLLLVSRQAWPQVEQFLRALGIAPDRIPPGQGLEVPGFEICRLPGASIDAGTAASAGTPPALAGVWPLGDSYPKLRGGLLLPQGSGQRTYLCHGAPDLLLPAPGASTTDVTITFGGEKLVLRPSGTTLALSQIATRPGQYDVAVGNSRLQFRLAAGAGLLRARAMAEISWPAGQWRPGRQAGEPGGICGALVDQPGRAIPSIRTGGCDTIWVFGLEPGQIAEVAAPGQAVHADLFGAARPTRADIDVAFTPVWIVREWAAQPGRRARIVAAPVTSSQPVTQPLGKPTPEQAARWRAELKRLSAASPALEWQSFVLRGWWTTRS